MRSNICLIRGHIAGKPVSVRGFVACACVRCGRPLELPGSNVARCDVVAGLARSLDDPTRIRASAGRVAERVR